MDNLLEENLYIKNFEESCILNESNYFDLNNLDFNTQGDSNLFIEKYQFDNRLNLDEQNQSDNDLNLDKQNQSDSNLNLDKQNQSDNILDLDEQNQSDNILDLDNQNQFDNILDLDEQNQFSNQKNINTLEQSPIFSNLILDNIESNQSNYQNTDPNLNILDDRFNNQLIQIADHNNEYNLVNQIDNNLTNNQIDDNLININQINNLNDEFKDLNFESLSNFFYTNNSDDNLLENYLLNYEFDLEDKNIFNGLDNLDNHFKNDNNGLIENSINQDYNQINYLTNELENDHLNNSNNKLINSINTLTNQTNLNSEIKDHNENKLKRSKTELNRKLDEYIRSEFMNITEDFEINHDLDKYYCDTCNQTFYLILDYNEHICNFNDHLIIKSNSLSNNKLIKSKKTILKCEYCLYSTPDKSKLKRHYVTHSRKKTFKCDYCGYKFTQASSLKKHKLDVHLKDNPQFNNAKLDNEQTINPLFNELIHDSDQTNLETGKAIDYDQLDKENKHKFDNYQIDEQLIEQMNSLINLNQDLNQQTIMNNYQLIDNQMDSNQFIFIDSQIDSNQLYLINNQLNYDLPFNDYQINQLNYNTNCEQNPINQICPNQYIIDSNMIIKNELDQNDLDNNYSRLFDFMY